MRRESGGDEPDLIGREDSSTAQAADAKFECSQGFIIDPAAKATTGKPVKACAVRRAASIRGNPKISWPATPRGNDSGRLGNEPIGEPWE
jgi:hypothetical protein